MSGAERRQWPQIPASLLSNLTASIVAGPDVRLVTLSRGGALMEVAARYPLRSNVRLKLTRAGGGVTQVNGTVSWAKVASITNGKINYLLAVIFEKPIEDLSAATGLADIEKHAAISMVSDPFEGTEAFGATLAAPTPLPPVEPAVPDGGTDTPASAAVLVEEDLSEATFTSRVVLTLFPDNASTPGQSIPAANGLPDAGREAPATAPTHVRELEDAFRRQDPIHQQALDDARAPQQQLEARLAKLEAERDEQVRALAEQQASVLSLATQLEVLEAERHQLRRDFEIGRAQWESERAELMTQAASRAEEFEAALDAREQAHAEALAREQSRFEQLLAELMQTANDQQAAYQQLMDERKAALEDHASRAERAQAELARVRTGAESERAALDARGRDLEARLEAAEAVAVAHENRHRQVCREAERLVALLASQSGAVVVDRESQFNANERSAQVVAGG